MDFWHGRCKRIGIHSMNRFSQFRLLTLAILALGASVCAAQGADAKSAAAAAKSEASKAKAGVSIDSLRKQLNEQRDNLVAEHEALAKQLKDATDAQKKDIKAKMEARMKEFNERQANLHKLLRDEQRRQRSDGGR